MLMPNERRPDNRTLERWAVALLFEEGAIKTCPEHGYMQCRGDPDAIARALATARERPPACLSTDDVLAVLHDVLGGIGETCPDCG
jgi:hypothetical protein